MKNDQEPQRRNKRSHAHLFVSIPLFHISWPILQQIPCTWTSALASKLTQQNEKFTDFWNFFCTDSLNRVAEILYAWNQDSDSWCDL